MTSNFKPIVGRRISREELDRMRNLETLIKLFDAPVRVCFNPNSSKSKGKFRARKNVGTKKPFRIIDTEKYPYPTTIQTFASVEELEEFTKILISKHTK